MNFYVSHDDEIIVYTNVEPTIPIELYRYVDGKEIIIL